MYQVFASSSALCGLTFGVYPWGILLVEIPRIIFMLFFSTLKFANVNDIVNFFSCFLF